MASVFFAGCGPAPETQLVRIDGSSTVLPIMEAAAELYRGMHPEVKIKIGRAGTGGGFKKFHDPRADLRIDISDASRPITPHERELCEKAGVQFIELPIGYDGIAVVVHSQNDFCHSLTVDELRRAWSIGGPTNWKDLRDSFPDLPLALYSPGADSGTFDYFREAVVKADPRADVNASEDDNVLVQGISRDIGALGYFGFAYYESNQNRLKLVAIDNGTGEAVLPSLESIRTQKYTPLSRPLFLYVNADASRRSEVRGFLRYLFERAREIVEHPKVGYVALSDELYARAWARFERTIVGTVYTDPSMIHRSLDELFSEDAP